MEPDPDEHQHPGLETIQWATPEAEDKSKNEKPSPGYSALSEMARKMVAGENACAMFCGGKKCKYCNADNWTPEQMAINGLFSHWVTDNILAMARPTTKAIEKFNILDQMKEKNIKTVINLQMAGEHGNCGEGNEPSGFSYNPQCLMDNQIFFYNFGWEDYGVTALHSLLDMVKVMQFAVSEGKVAVHCHAGLGRTGLLIACYLVFNNRMTGREAIHFTRSKRPGSIQTSQQMETVCQFEKFLAPFRVIFPARKENFHEFSLKQFLARQKLLLHGFEGRKLKFIPKIVYVCCERLLELANKGQALTRVRSAVNLVSFSMTDAPSAVISSSSSQEKSASLPTLLEEPPPIPAVRKSSSKLSFTSRGSASYLPELSGENFELPDTQHSIEKDSPHEEGKEEEEEVKQTESTSRKESASRRKSSKSVSTKGPIDNKGSVNAEELGKSVAADKSNSAEKKPRKKENDETVSAMNGGQHNSGERAGVAGTSRGAGFSSTVDSDDDERGRVGKQNGGPSSGSPKTFLGLYSPEQVVEAMASPDYMGLNLEEARQLEEELNETDLAWNKLAHENRPELVAKVMWDWFDQLKEPVLIAQELNAMVQHVKDPKTALLKVEKSTRTLFEYLLRVVARLQPEGKLKTRLLHHLLGHLTHQVVLPSPSMYELAHHDQHWPQMKSGASQALCDLTCNLLDAYAAESSSRLDVKK